VKKCSYFSHELRTTNMDLKLLSYFLKLGQFLALTPPSVDSKTYSFGRKLYIILTSALSTVALATTLVSKNFYGSQNLIKGAVCLLEDINLLVVNLYPMIILGFWKRQLWVDVFDNLKATEYLVLTKKTQWEEKFEFVCFVLASLVFILSCVFEHYIYYKMGGLDYMVKDEIMYVLAYFKYFFNLLLVGIIHMLLTRYKGIRRLLEDCLKNDVDDNLTSRKLRLNFIKNIERGVDVLNKTVTIFNDMFGWVIFLMISHTLLVTLDILDCAIFDTEKLYLAETITGLFCLFAWNLVIVVILHISLNNSCATFRSPRQF
jgi:hypothetical protein